MDFDQISGFSITLQSLGQDFNQSRGLCGNFNGLRDDDVSNEIQEQIWVEPQKILGCANSKNFIKHWINSVDSGAQIYEEIRIDENLLLADISK